MNKLSILVVIIPYFILANSALTPVTLLDTLNTRHPSIFEYKSYIKQEDSLAFFSEDLDNDRKQMLFEDTVIVTCNGLPHYSRSIIKDKGRAIRWASIDSIGRIDFLAVYRSNGSLHKTLNYTYDDNGKRHKNIIYHSAFEDYKWGVQPPTIFDVAHPTGFTISGFNFHFELPVPHIGGKIRPTIALAAEAGVNGVGLRTGLVVPFIIDGYGVDWIKHTPVTINASFTYIYREAEYDNLRGPTPYRWHVGVDADYNIFMFGHIRLGAYRLIGPEDDRPWNIMFSIGVSPALFAIPFTAH